MEINTIADAVRAFFKENDWKYAEEDGIFESGTPLDAPINSALIHIITDETALAVLTALDYTIPEESTFTVLEFCNLANMLLPAGCFYLDRAEQMLVFRLTEFIPEGTELPDSAEIEDQLLFALTNLQQAAKVLGDLLDGAVSVEEAVEIALRPPFDEEGADPAQGA